MCSLPRIPSTGFARPGRVGSAFVVALVFAALASFVGCTSQRWSDPLVERCGEVLRYEQPDWSDVEILDVRRGTGRAVTLHVRGVLEPERETVSDFIECVFRPGERAAVERVVIGDRTLGAKELALVNAELLLRDLGGGTGG